MFVVSLTDNIPLSICMSQGARQMKMYARWQNDTVTSNVFSCRVNFLFLVYLITSKVTSNV